MQRPNPRQSNWTRADFFGLAYMLASGHAACCFVFTRMHFGPKAFEMAGPMAILMMFLYAAFAPCPAMIYFAAVWVALLIVHRMVTLIKGWQGWETHSYDDGNPWLVMAIFRPKSDYIAKAACEPVLAIIAGTLLCLASEKLGFFVMAASVSLCVRRVIEHGIRESQYRAMRDQEFEMQARMERFHGRSQ